MKKNMFRRLSVILSIMAVLTTFYCSSAESKDTNAKNRSFSWKDGSSYTGDWQGERTGRGTYKWKSGDRYEGDFVKGKKHGNGTYTWADGSVYTGQWQNDQIHGTGKMVWSKGFQYEGEWENGRSRGYAVKTEKNDSQ